MVCMYFYLYLYLYLYWRDWKNCVGELRSPVAVHPFVLFERSRLWKEMFLKQFANIFCYGVVLTRFQLKASLKSPNYTMKWSPPQIRLATLLLQELHLELDKAEFVLLIVLHPAIVGAALHVDELALRLGGNLDCHQRRVVSNLRVHLVPLALKENNINLKIFAPW